MQVFFLRAPICFILKQTYFVGVDLCNISVGQNILLVTEFYFIFVAVSGLSVARPGTLNLALNSQSEGHILVLAKLFYTQYPQE